MDRPLITGKHAKRPPSAERRDYLIEGFQVSFLHQAEWQCACREFGAAGMCRHTREASGMRDAQALIRRRMGTRVSDFLPYTRLRPKARIRAAGPFPP
jgi:hypothetical protein